jgi:hypothetical protein
MFLLAGWAVVTRDGNLAAFGVVRVWAIAVVDTAADAHPVVCRLDLLNVESSDVVSREDTERLRRDTIVTLSAGVKLAALVRGVQTAQVASVDAPSDLTDHTARGTCVLYVLRVGEPIGGELTLVGVVVSRLGSAIGLGAATFGNADVGVRVEGSDETHIRQAVDLDDVVAAVLELVDVRYGSDGDGSSEESNDGGSAHVC